MSRPRRPAAAIGLALALAVSGCDDGAEGCADGLSSCEGACRDPASFASDPDHCGACDVSCGAGTCAGGACACVGPTCEGGGCQTEHDNGLGQAYYDCSPLEMHTRAQAELAAAAWNPGGSLRVPGRCATGCLCTESATEAAVWCHLGSGTRAGWVMVTPTPSCPGAFCPDLGYGVPWN